jgi:hypothetical protein
LTHNNNNVSETWYSNPTKWGVSQWQTHLTSHAGDAAGRKLVFIGGPHRGGTTYIWQGGERKAIELL